MARSGNGTAAGPLVLTVADVLPEGAGSLDGGLVDLLVLPDVVDGWWSSRRRRQGRYQS